ncbi:MAG: hypothetical protein A2Y62_09505 [Candidatus Fischerbacteria bacterium RBG_13_37_8]|uniref:DNA-directed RNA polymerase subunit omega n=1 Tax=Candidatus Fischerbacteria bacterium RBG_13_37_8 TaxID=1817863 RepID=A0A1F5VJQ4_9BACT|nr:MAG: hypothetical protein A2Y62_09505 [Candidatus Fischerbacteria bacterium RBG_13_37_8]
MVLKVNFDDIDNPFLFVVVSSERAEQLQRGALPRVTMKTKKSTTLAMAEMLKHRVKYQAKGEEEIIEEPEETSPAEE